VMLFSAMSTKMPRAGLKRRIDGAMEILLLNESRKREKRAQNGR
jgi:hypothetical protein